MSGGSGEKRLGTVSFTMSCLLLYVNIIFSNCLESCLYQYIASWPRFCSHFRDFLFPTCVTRYFGVCKTAVSKRPEEESSRIQTSPRRAPVAGGLTNRLGDSEWIGPPRPLTHLLPGGRGPHSRGAWSPWWRGADRRALPRVRVFSGKTPGRRAPSRQVLSVVTSQPPITSSFSGSPLMTSLPFSCPALATSKGILIPPPYKGVWNL